MNTNLLFGACDYARGLTNDYVLFPLASEETAETFRGAPDPWPPGNRTRDHHAGGHEFLAHISHMPEPSDAQIVSLLSNFLPSCPC